MKAEELRIGNYLQDREGRLCQVVRLEPGETEDIRFFASAIEGGLTMLPVEPIPLTTEWLERFGFVNPRNGCVFLFNFAEEFSCMFEKGEILIEEYGEGAFPLRHIKHVHQLQNLYFALTAEELKLKK